MELASVTQLSESQFMRWVKYFSPPLYNRVMETPNNLGFNISDFIDKTLDIGKEYLKYDQQKELLKLQAERARAGLPPLNTGTASQIITVQQTPTPEQLQTQQLTTTLLKILPWILGGLLAIKLID